MPFKISSIRTINDLYRIIFKLVNQRRGVKECYICKKKFVKFRKYRLVDNSISRASHFFKIVSSDTQNFSCYYCNSTDRDRHIFMFFDKLSLWDKFSNAKILHFAPEKSISQKIVKLSPDKYIKCDLFPKDDWIKVDITKIPFEENYFDILICNHVLEHIPNHLQALKEIKRVLKKKGIAILQTPVSDLLYYHFEDQNINTEDLRLCFYGQEDHVKILSKRQFLDELSILFELNLVSNKRFFSSSDCFKYGVNCKEDLIMVTKR